MTISRLGCQTPGRSLLETLLSLCVDSTATATPDGRRLQGSETFTEAPALLLSIYTTTLVSRGVRWYFVFLVLSDEL